MSHDPLSNPFIANKLARAQAELAATVRPGSVPHPRRVIKDAAKFSSFIDEPKPQRKPRRKRKSSE